jgi:hypothetical protein
MPAPETIARRIAALCTAIVGALVVCGLGWILRL